MNEKCPCGCPGSLNDKTGPYYRCENCWFRCDKADLPRIAAAMELARAHVWEAEQSRKGLSYMTRHKAAKKRVLEVFGGE